MKHRSFLNITMLGILLSAPDLVAATVVIRSPQVVKCVSAGAESTIEQKGSAVSWDDSVAQRLECGGNGLEPRDLLATDASADFFPASPLEIAGVSGPITVTWIQIGEEPIVLAERNLVAAAPVVVPVARKRGRWIRVGRKGASPVTLRVPDDPAAKLIVPAATPGGEIFGRISARRFYPEAIVTTGGQKGRVEDGFFTISGVPAGPTLIRAIYASGYEQKSSRTLRVVNEQSSWTTLADLPRAASLEVLVEPSACGEKNSLTLSSGGTRLYSHVVDPRTCRLTVEGIPPLPIDVHLYDQRADLIGVADALALTDEIVTVSLSANLPVVHGVVSVGDTRAPATRLRFTNEKDPPVDVMADESGSYVAHLSRTGQWSIHSFVAQHIYVQGGLSKEFVAGDQEFDVHLPAGELHVIVETEDPTISHVQIAIAGPSAVSSFMAVREPLVLRGLPMGEYSISASLPGKANARASVQIDESDPSKSVTLTLRRQPLSIVIRSSGGAAIPNARATANARVMTANSEGSLAADDLMDGAAIRVTAPGFEPACALVQRPVTTVIMTPRGSLDARVITHEAAPAFALARDGSMCAIQSFDLTWRRDKTGFVLEGLNPGGYTLFSAGKAYRLVVPGQPLEIP